MENIASQVPSSEASQTNEAGPTNDGPRDELAQGIAEAQILSSSSSSSRQIILYVFTYGVLSDG